MTEARPTDRSLDAVTLRAIAPSMFLPAAVYEIGNGAITPIIALTALRLGATPATAGFSLALLGIGQIVGDLPAAALADRIGDRRAMVLAAALAFLCAACCLVAGSIWTLGCALTGLGCANSTFYLARQSYLSEVAPVRLRARAMSTLGGSHRIGLFVGPFIGAAVIHVAGLRSAYAVAMAASAAAAVLLLVIPDVTPGAGTPAPAERGTASSLTMLARNRRLFATLGLAVLTVGAVRAARQTVLPLWAEHLGISAEHTSLIFGIANALDMALFYPAGKVMDSYGRLCVAVPSMLLIATAMIALPLTHNGLALTLVAMVMSAGNGIGSGIIMTLGADTAPAANRTRFLAIWRLFSDSGNAAGPVVVSVVATLASLATGIAAIGCVGLVAAAALARWVPRYSPFATRHSLRAHQDANPSAASTPSSNAVAPERG